MKTDIIAHAGGNYFGLDHTNSKEALEDFINKTSDHEVRVAELDFDFTSDDVLVCSHLYTDKGLDHIPTYEEYMNYSEIGFTTMDLSDVLYYMSQNKNLYIMVDTKVENHTNKSVVDIARYITEHVPKEYVDRFIYQLYRPAQKEEMLSFYKFKDENLVLSIYKNRPGINQTLREAYEYNYSVILFNKKYFNDEDLKRITDKNFVTIVYTVNSDTQKEELKNKGISIVITDNLY
jgi:glycerophosphoryl diester phosphodiesterase